MKFLLLEICRVKNLNYENSRNEEFLLHKISKEKNFGYLNIL